MRNTGKFERLAPVVMQAVMDRYGLKDFQAAGVLGNLGRESDGFNALREHQFQGSPGVGGYGWAQWTGPRAEAFLAWCDARHLSWASTAANVGYLIHELDGPYRSVIDALKASRTLRAATVSFEIGYERAGVKAYPSRIEWAQLALSAYKKRGQAGA